MGPPYKSSPPNGEPSVARAGEGRYRIQVVAEMTGVPSATLRAWERRYGIPTPARTESSYRLYSDHDVELVRSLNAFCAAGMAPAEAARRVRETSTPLPPTPHPTHPDPYQELVTQLVDAVVRFDLEALDTAVAQAMSIGSASSIFERVVVPVQREVGERWHGGTLSVAHEHLVTEALAAATHTLHRLVQPVGAQRAAILACFADEEHTLPLYGVAFRLASWGLRTVVLGARTPPDAVESARRALQPALICLSVTVAPAPAAAATLVRAYASACAPVPWMVGGLGARAIGPLVEAEGGTILPGDELTRARFDEAMERRPRGPR